MVWAHDGAFEFESCQNHCLGYNPVQSLFPSSKTCHPALRKDLQTESKPPSHIRPYRLAPAIPFHLPAIQFRALSLTMRETVLGNAPNPGQWAATQATKGSRVYWIRRWSRIERHGRVASSARNAGSRQVRRTAHVLLMTRFSLWLIWFDIDPRSDSSCSATKPNQYVRNAGGHHENAVSRTLSQIRVYVLERVLLWRKWNYCTISSPTQQRHWRTRLSINTSGKQQSSRLPSSTSFWCMESSR